MKSLLLDLDRLFILWRTQKGIIADEQAWKNLLQFLQRFGVVGRDAVNVIGRLEQLSLSTTEWKRLRLHLLIPLMDGDDDLEWVEEAYEGEDSAHVVADKCWNIYGHVVVVSIADSLEKVLTEWNLDAPPVEQEQAAWRYERVQRWYTPVETDWDWLDKILAENRRDV